MNTESKILTDVPGPAPTDDRAGGLRVLVVTVSAGGIGGMQQHTHDLVRGLVASGHDVEVVCPAAAGLTDDLHGATWTLLETCGRADPRWGEKLDAAYDAAVARGPFDVVHSESTSAASLVRRRIEPPVVVMYHGNVLGLSKAHVRRTLARPTSAPKELAQLVRLLWRYVRHRNPFAFRGCEVMVVSHQQVRGTAYSGLIRPENVHVVPNGVDVSVFRPVDRAAARRELELEADVVLCAVGRLNHEKGFDVALQAFARITADHPGARLLIVGDGEERVALERLAQRLGLDERAIFAGAQPQPRVSTFLGASDVFVFPTRRDEAGPLVLPQAMACGTAVVASRIGGIGEVVEPPDEPPAGLLVRPGDIHGLELALRRLLDDPALRTSLGTRARARATENYSLEVMVARTVAVYRTAIARAGRPS